MRARRHRVRLRSIFLATVAVLCISGKRKQKKEEKKEREKTQRPHPIHPQTSVHAGGGRRVGIERAVDCIRHCSEQGGEFEGCKQERVAAYVQLPAGYGSGIQK